MKYIINTVSDQLTPNYIFIREIAEPSDILIFITTFRMKDKLNIIKRSISEFDYISSDLIFDSDGIENDYSEMYNQLEKKFKEIISSNENCQIIANLTGGTKLMSITLKEVLEKKYKSVKFYYIPITENKITFLEKNRNDKRIEYRVCVNEYFKIFGINKFRQCNELVENSEYTNKFFNKFQLLTDTYYETINLLRDYRNDKRKSPYLIKDIEKGIKEKDNSQKRPVNNLIDLLSFMEFPIKENGKLYPSEISYLTGGWFEEYTFTLLKNRLTPDDIIINAKILETENINMNEFDVVFTLGNKLFIIECKTKIESNSEFNNITDKLSALKDTLLGKLGVNSYLFSLEKENEKWIKKAKNKLIKYCSKEYFNDETKLNELLNDIRKKTSI